LNFLARELRDDHLAGDPHFEHDTRARSVAPLADDMGVPNEFPRFGENHETGASAPAAAGRLKRKKPAYRWLSFLFRFPNSPIPRLFYSTR
jgi:hypothetical protein